MSLSPRVKAEGAMTQDHSDRIHRENQPLPLYEQVRQDLLERINTGEWGPGDALPTEMSLIEAYGVSRVTMRRAISELVQSGYLFRRSGKGTFVRDRMQYYIPDGMLGFLEHSLHMGDEASYEVVALDTVPAPAVEAGLLSVAEGDPLRHLVLKRLIDGRVAGWQEIYMLEDYAGPLQQDDIEAHSERFPLFSLTGVHITRRIARMRAQRANMDDVRYLNCSEGDPILFLEVVSSTEDEQPVAVNRTSHHGDLFEYYYNIISD